MPISPILIVDDDTIFLDTVTSTLRLRLPDVHMETVDSALAALERIRSMEYTAIICDAHQPRLEGIGFVRAVRKVHSEWPVLLLLEKYHEDLIRQAMDAGAYDVLVKPVEEGALLFAVQRAIEVSRLRNQVKREGAQLVETVRGMMRDLEVLYGADGLQVHFEAFMARVDAERQALSTTSKPPSNSSD
ncbi:MAG: response regulator [Nitrospirae bacterium]|nr:response regulator [Nitrospirota bacterium]